MIGNKEKFLMLGCLLSVSLMAFACGSETEPVTIDGPGPDVVDPDNNTPLPDQQTPEQQIPDQPLTGFYDGAAVTPQGALLRPAPALRGPGVYEVIIVDQEVTAADCDTSFISEYIVRAFLRREVGSYDPDDTQALTEFRSGRNTGNSLVRLNSLAGGIAGISLSASFEAGEFELAGNIDAIDCDAE